MSDWIPVKKELPSNNRPVLAFVEDAYGAGKLRVIKANYARKFELEVHIDHCEDFGEYDEKTDEYYAPEGWYEANSFHDVDYLIDGIVTYWMELPKSPNPEPKE